MSANAVPVTVAMPAYHHANEIISGEVPLAGMRPRFVSREAGAGAEIVDLPLASYVSRRLGGDTTLTAVPVFLARAFVHSWVHVASRDLDTADIEQAGDEACIYARGILADRGEERERVLIAPPGTVRGRSDLKPLFENATDLEREDYVRTGIYPILSVLAISTDLIASERWLATNVYRAFEICRRRYFGRLQDIRGSRVPIPSVAGHLRELSGISGPELWPYGLEPNRSTLEAFLRYAANQGVIESAPDDVAEIFAFVEPFVDYTDGI
jgi:hypothetical protein